MDPLIARLRENILKVFLGPPDSVDRVICCLLARGHLLIEDVPGVGKTLLATALARSLDLNFTRVQLTPDMLPSDVLGVSVLDRASGDFRFRRGPIFTNVLLADEINRTPPRTQSALLEAMSEAAVSAEGRTMPLDPPFFVVATQNPYSFEGTYPLPENQLDRFLMRVRLGYPTGEEEARLLELRPSSGALGELRAVMQKDDLLGLQRRVDGVRLDRSLLEYIVAFANATRRSDQIQLGLSPRGALALAQAARATAMFNGRDYVVPDDVVHNVIAVCAHRVIPAGFASEDATGVLEKILHGVTSPS